MVGDLPQRVRPWACQGRLMGVAMTNSRIPLLIVLSAVIGNPCAEALWAQTPSAPSSGNPRWVTDRDAEMRSNSVVWDQERWQPWVVELKAEDITHVAGYNARLSGNVRLTSADDVEPRRTPYGFITATDHLTWTIAAPAA